MAKRKHKPKNETSTAGRLKKPPPLRVHGPDTPAELKQRFAENIDQLLKLIGLSRKEAAENTGLPYKLIRRLASAGVSRVDARNKESLDVLAKYFALPNTHDFWLVNLIPWLLEADEGQRFIRKFRTNLRKYRDEQVQHIDQRRLQLIEQALGMEKPSENAVEKALVERVRIILASDRGEHFRRLIDDYVELVTKGKATTG